MGHEELELDMSRMVADKARLAAVQATGLLDPRTEECFDRLTRLAMTVTDAPVSFFSVVAEDHDYFKSCCGIPGPLATSRKVVGRSFCHFALAGAEHLAVSDARTDARYSSLSSVKELGVVAYLGIPLHIEGQPIGSFCVVDFKPRNWTEKQVKILTEFAHSVVREVQLRLASEKLTKEEEKNARIINELTAKLRDPLTILSLHLDLLLDHGPPPEMNDHVDHIRIAVDRIENGISKVLSTSRGELRNGS